MRRPPAGLHADWRRADLGRLAHHRLVERGAPGGLEQHHVVAAEGGGFRLRAFRSAAASGPRSPQRCRSRFAAEHGEQLHRRWPTARRARPSCTFPLPVGEAPGDFGGGGGFAGALQADHHDGDRRRGVKIDALAFGCAPSVATSWSCTILTTIWPGRDRLHHLDADGLLLHVVGEGARATSSATSALPAARAAPRAAPHRRRLPLSAPRRVRRSRMPPSCSDRSGQQFFFKLLSFDAWKGPWSGSLPPLLPPLPLPWRRGKQLYLYARGRIALSGGGLRSSKDRAASWSSTSLSRSGRNLRVGLCSSQGSRKLRPISPAQTH